MASVICTIDGRNRGPGAIALLKFKAFPWNVNFAIEIQAMRPPLLLVASSASDIYKKLKAVIEGLFTCLL